MSPARAALVAIAVPVAGTALLVIAFMVQGFGIAHRREAHPVPALRIAPDASRLARGQHLLDVACAGCHAPGGAPGALTGGDRNLLDVPGGRRWGVLEAPNLTPGSPALRASDGELARAIREGVGRGGRPLLVHPAAGRDGFSDADLAALLTALRAGPPSPRPTRPRRLGALLCLALGSHFVETSVTHPVPRLVPEPPAGFAAGHGRYLARVLACDRCHGRDMDGRLASPLAPRGGDLVRFARERTLQQFDDALRHGRSPGGRPLARDRMPFAAFSRLDHTEVGALYTWLQTLSARR